MRKLKWPLLRPLFFIILSTLLLLSCGCSIFDGTAGSSSSPQTSTAPSPSPTEAPEKSIEGILTEYTGSLLSIETEDGEEYSFAVTGLTLSGLPNAKAGDSFTVWYQGTLDTTKKQQTVTVTRAEKTEEAEFSENSIPIAWKDDGIFSKNYSKAYVALQSMSLEEKVGQLLLGRVPESDAGSDVLTYHLGGYVTFGRDYENKTRWQIQNMIQGWQSAAKIPLIISVDEEGGEVVRISSNSNIRSTPFRSPQLLFAMGGMEKIKSDAEEKAKLLLDLGVNVNLAPVADVSTDKKDFIYSRSLGQGPQETAEYVATVTQTFQKEGLSAVLKHFPGYGSNSDTHAGASIDKRTLSQLESRDLVPFQEGIEAGAYAIMVSHNTVTCMDDKLPASLSPSVHNYLRDTMGFTGIIVTDDLSMEAIAGQDFGLSHDAYVQAVLAGNDMLICSDYQTAYQSILKAVQDGTITEEQLNHSVFRILGWKCTLGLM